MSIYTPNENNELVLSIQEWIKHNPFEIPADSKDNNSQKGELNGFYGKHHTEETKKLISENKKPWNHTEDAKERIRNARKDKPRSAETKQKISLKNSKENHHMWNKSCSEELKKKISETKKNNPYKHSEEIKLRISEAAKLREQKKKLNV
jgi:hypothetical protein